MKTMKLKATVIVITLACLSVSSAFALDDAKKKKKPTKRRVNPAMQMPEIDPSLPNVLILGDSISIGYTVPLRAELKGEANVIRPATNCGPTTSGLKGVESWIGDRKWDVIHFNFGLHDLKYMGPNGENLADPKAKDSAPQVPIDEYEANLRTIATRLKKTGAKLIWRETTPITPGTKGRVPGDSAKYNVVAAKVMDELGVVETDPMHHYASEKEIASLQLPANVHYTAAGSKALAKKAAESIRAALQSAK